MSAGAFFGRNAGGEVHYVFALDEPSLKSPAGGTPPMAAS